LFESKTEPIFLASLKNKSENSKEIVRLVLPQLLIANRSDSFAVKFYIEAYLFESPEASQVIEIISRAYCEGTWKDVDQTLHKKCEEIFQGFDHKFRGDMLRRTAESSLSGKIHQLKLLNKNDLRLLRKLKVKMGLSMSFFDLLPKIGTKLFGFTRILASKFLIIRTWVFIMVAIFVISLVYRGWQTQKEMTAEVEGQAIDRKEKKSVVLRNQKSILFR